MTRTTIADLDRAVDAVNRAAGTPLETWSVDGSLTPNAFNYHLSGAYGGYSLHQHGATGSGGRDVFQVGHVPKRELHGMLRAYRAGLEAGTTFGPSLSIGAAGLMADQKLIRLETGMMDQIMLVCGTGPVETWDVLRVWHTSQREEAEQYLAELTGGS